MTTPNGGGPQTLWVPGAGRDYREMTVGEKAADLDALNRSVIAGEAGSQTPALLPSRGFMLWALAQAADTFSPWGAAPKVRDAQMRSFWHTENMLAGAVATVTARNAALSWEINGPPLTSSAAADMLQNANFGAGWEDFIVRVSIDLYTQDSGAFVELIRAGNTEDSPVIGIAHLDALRCYPTGDPETPVIYLDAESKYHALKWFQVVQLLELPSPITPQVGGYFFRLQYAATTRVLRAAEIIKSIGVYNEEKISGRFQNAVHLVTGVDGEEIRDGMTRRQNEADVLGLQRFVMPPIITSIKPDARVGHEVIEMTSLPPGWDEEKSFKWYINALALGFMTDYQEFAPLPGGGLGTSAQSEVLHQKSRGKGPALFQQLIARLLNLHGVLPRNVEFQWAEPDVEAEQQEAALRKTRAETRKLDIESGVLTAEAAQQQALDVGDISDEVFKMLGAIDVTPERTVESEERTDVREMRTVSALGHVPQSGAKAMRPVTLGELITSRLHRAYSDTSDDASALGYFDRLDDRLAVANSIGPALTVFEDLLREAGVWDIEIAPEDADLIFEASVKSLSEGFKAEDDDRAGPEDARLDFEREVEEEVGKGLATARRLLSRRLRAEG